MVETRNNPFRLFLGRRRISKGKYKQVFFTFNYLFVYAYAFLDLYTGWAINNAPKHIKQFR